MHDALKPSSRRRPSTGRSGCLLRTVSVVRFAVETPGFGTWSDPAAVVELAELAESAGWDGLFLWDHLNADAWTTQVGDPWVALAGAAMRTRRIRLGTAVTPVPRHLPHVFARTLAAVDRLSGGRVVLGAGLGTPAEFALYGDQRDDKARAGHADEFLEVLSRLLAGEEVTHVGDNFRLNGARLGPLPIQRPRVPVWIGGVSRPALRRAARWDGWIVPCVGPDAVMFRGPEEIAAAASLISDHRSAADGDFQVAITAGSADATDVGNVLRYEQVGVTWWLESISDLRGVETSLRRVAAGPPRPE